MYIVFLGAPGAGKGTQAALLAEKQGLKHISTGEVLRDAVRRGTELGKQAKGYMDRGELVPDALVVDVVVDRLSQEDTAKGAVLDGFPRNVPQAKALDEALKARGDAVDLVVFLNVPEASLVSRLAGRLECAACRTSYHQNNNPPKKPGGCDQCDGALTQRADDRPETVRRRLQVYFEQTAPLIEYYRERGILVEVDGDKPIPLVADQVLAAVQEKERIARGEKAQKAGG
ncbi:MAG: adenylate kinase [Chloroflexota bacterium]